MVGPGAEALKKGRSNRQPRHHSVQTVHFDQLQAGEALVDQSRKREPGGKQESRYQEIFLV